MNTENNAFFKNKKPILIGSIAVILIGIAAFFIFRKHKPAEMQQAYAKYIEGYTSGTVSKKSFIRIQLASQVKTMGELGKPDERNLFSFSPSVKGKTYWIDAQTVEFRPDEKLESGKTYTASFNLGKVTETDERSPTADKIAIENGRWGPFIRFGKDMLKLGKNPATNDKYTPEELAVLSLEEVKKLIVEQVPNAFEPKATKKKAAGTKVAGTKSAAVKAPAKKKAPVKKK